MRPTIAKGIYNKFTQKVNAVCFFSNVYYLTPRARRKYIVLADTDINNLSPAERRRTRTRQSILDAAERVLADEGEAGLSIRRLADEIDYSPAAIYKYFESKQHLVDALKEEFFAELLNQLEDVDATPQTYLAHAHRCLAIYIRSALDRPHHYIAAFSGQADEAGQLSMPDDDSNKARAFMKLHTMVADGVAVGAFRADLDILQTAKSVWAAIHGFVMLVAHLPNFAATFAQTSPPSQEVFMSRHIDFILGGLRP